MYDLMIIDGHALLTRAFYGVKEPLAASDGRPTNAVYGFMQMLDRAVREEQPASVCVAFDVDANTFRRQLYAAYKATRPPQPEELRVQLAPTKALLTAMGIPLYECRGYEADDVIGTLAAACERANRSAIIFTGDRDVLQLVSDKTTVQLIRHTADGNLRETYTPETFSAMYGFSPAALVELKALMGDHSDNIPGVRGIGEKTAMKLIQRYGKLETLYDAIARDDEWLRTELRPSAVQKLRDGQGDAAFSRVLATIRRDVPVRFDAAAIAANVPSWPRVQAVIEALGFVGKYIPSYFYSKEKTT